MHYHFRIKCLAGNQIAFILFVCLSVIFSCSPEKRSDQKDQSVQDSDHGNAKQETTNGVDIKVTYRPQDMLIQQEIKAKPGITTSELDNLKKQYKKQLYFVLSLSHNNQEILNAAASREQFSDMVNLLAFDMGNHVSLVSSLGDTLEFMDAVFPRTFGMSVSSDILLAFENLAENDSAEWLRLTINELGLKTGNVIFDFDISEIKNYKNYNLN